ncbi:MAG: Rab family GTPase [Promethearchaeota archaeon]
MPDEFNDKNKKIVLIGPLAAGKTTFKRVFFENANPLKLIKDGLDPTRGIENSIYKIFERNVALWDLAGQELNYWLNERKEVLRGANVIVCFTDVSKSLKETMKFLIKFLKVRNAIAPFSNLFILLNKCDLLPEIEVNNKIINIEKFIEVKFPEFAKNCNRKTIYKTSIMENYFLRSLNVAFKIIKVCVEKKMLEISVKEMMDVEKRLEILLNSPKDVWFSISDIKLKTGFPENTLRKYARDLMENEFIMCRQDDGDIFRLTEKAIHFINACKIEAESIKARQFRESIGLFLNIKERLIHKPLIDKI